MVLRAYRVDYKVKSVIIGGEQIKLQIWDTAGQERFRNIAPGELLRLKAANQYTCLFKMFFGVIRSACVPVATVYFRGADGLMLVFDVTSEESFENIRNWIRDINKHVEKASVQKVLVGNKADLLAESATGTVRLPGSHDISCHDFCPALEITSGVDDRCVCARLPYRGLGW